MVIVGFQIFSDATLPALGSSHQTKPEIRDSSTRVDFPNKSRIASSLYQVDATGEAILILIEWVIGIFDGNSGSADFVLQLAVAYCLSRAD